MKYRNKFRRYSSVSTVTILRPGRPESRFRQRQGLFALCHRLWGPHSLLSNGYRGLFPRD